MIVRMLRADWARFMWTYPMFKLRLVAHTKLSNNWKISSACVRGYSCHSSWWLRFWKLITNLIRSFFLGTPNPGKHQSRRSTSYGSSCLIMPMLHWCCNSLSSAALCFKGVGCGLFQTGVAWGLSFNSIGSPMYLPQIPWKTLLFFDEYCKQLHALSISKACALVDYTLKVWFIIIIWQKFCDKSVLVERKFEKAFFDIHLIDIWIAKFWKYGMVVWLLNHCKFNDQFFCVELSCTGSACVVFKDSTIFCRRSLVQNVRDTIGVTSSLLQEIDLLWTRIQVNLLHCLKTQNDSMIYYYLLRYNL